MKYFSWLILFIAFVPIGQTQNIGFGTAMPVNSLSVSGKVNITDSLGIGTNNPMKRLDVNGDALINTLLLGRGGGAQPTNTTFGFNSLHINQTGSNNTAIGYSTMKDNLTGISNTAAGFWALLSNTTGHANTAIGASGMTTNITGSSNTTIGSFANVGSNNLSNATAIGANAAVTASNSLVLGSDANVGIGTSSPTTKLEVIGKLKTNQLQMTSGVSNEFVLKSDASGNASWVNLASLETDPQIGSLTTGRIPRWNGTQLVDGTLFTPGIKIGLGMTTPEAKLDIVASNNSIRLLSGANTSHTSLQLGRTVKEGSWGVAAGAGHFAIGAVAGDIIFRSETISERLVFANGPNIPTLGLKNSNTGINAINPMSKLSINGNAVIGADYAGSNTVSQNCLAIQGCVGIGTSTPNPAGRLHVAVPIQKTSTLPDTVAFLGTNDGTPFGLQISLKGGASLSARSAFMQTTEGSSEGGRLILEQGGGAVGIGTTSPITTLDVNGGIKNQYGGVRHLVVETVGSAGEVYENFNSGIPNDWNDSNTVIYMQMLDDEVHGWFRNVTLNNGTIDYECYWYVPFTGGGTYDFHVLWTAIRVH